MYTVVRSNKQALSELASGMKLLAESQAKCHNKSLVEDRKMEEREMKFRREEAEKNQKHELEIAKIYAAAFAGMKERIPEDSLAGIVDLDA